MSEKLVNHRGDSEVNEWDKLKDSKEDRFDTAMKEMIEKEGEDYFSTLVNCGGFALGVLACVFSGSKSMEEAKKNILQTFPFVRVDDGAGLGENEYRVIYRHAEGGVGHHFIKEVNGQLMEKDGRNPVQKFEKWGPQLEDAPEVTLVVNREHEVRPRDEDGEFRYSFII